MIVLPLGGPDGELSASMRYLSQRYTMPYKECMATLTDIGTEELAHLEMICTIVYQLTKNMTIEELKASGFDKYYVDHTAAQKARTTYDNLLRLIKDPEVADPLRFLREREIVHYQRFGECLRITQEHLDAKNFYIMNPEFDTGIQGNCKN